MHVMIYTKKTNAEQILYKYHLFPFAPPDADQNVVKGPFKILRSIWVINTLY